MRLRLKSGLCLGYQTMGAGKVAVLLHPIGTESGFWLRACAHLQEFCRPIAVDLRGHGESDVPNRSFSLDDLAGDVIELIETFGVSPAVIIGCSLGGMVAQSVALQAPKAVAGLVLSNTAHTLPDAGRAVMAERAEQARHGMPPMVPGTIDRWFSTKFRENEPEIVEGVRESLLAIDPVVHSWGWSAISALDFTDKASEIKCPTLVCAGSEDVGTPPPMAQALQEAIPGAQYREAVGAAHMLPMEQPALFAQWVKEFMEDFSQCF